MRASGRSTKSILTWRSWWRTRTPPSGRSSSPLTSWPTSPSGCLWTGSTRDGNVLILDKIETHIKFCKVPTKPVTEPRVSEIIQCVMNKSWNHAKFISKGIIKSNILQERTRRKTRTHVLELVREMEVFSGLVWSCDALMMHWWWTDDGLMMRWWCTYDALMMRWWCSSDALMMCWWYADDVLMMHL